MFKTESMDKTEGLGSTAVKEARESKATSWEEVVQ